MYTDRDLQIYNQAWFITRVHLLPVLQFLFSPISMPIRSPSYLLISKSTQGPLIPYLHPSPLTTHNPRKLPEGRFLPLQDVRKSVTESPTVKDIFSISLYCEKSKSFWSHTETRRTWVARRWDTHHNKHLPTPIIARGKSHAKTAQALIVSYTLIVSYPIGWQGSLFRGSALYLRPTKKSK